MKLYLYKQVNDVAMAKWGTEAKLTEAFVARSEQPKRRHKRADAAYAKSLDGAAALAAPAHCRKRAPYPVCP